MHFSLIITLCLHCLLCQRVRASRNSFLKNQTLSIGKVDNIFGEFLAEFNKARLEKSEPRQVAIIGRSIDELPQARSLSENIPLTTCADPETCVYPEVFDSRSYFIVFLKDLGKNTLEKNLKILLRCKSECESLFVYEGFVNKSNNISSFLSRAVLQGIVYPEFSHVEKNTIKFYHPMVNEDCSVGVISSFVWRPGTDLSKIFVPFSQRALDLNGCPITVGTVRSVPKMITEENKNGSITIVGGSEGRLVLLIAEILNFTVVVKYPSIPPKRNQATKDLMISEIASGVTKFGIARLRPFNSRFNNIVFSKSYDNECLTFGVSRRMTTTINFVWMEFPTRIWVLIGLVFVIICVIGHIHHKLISSVNGYRKRVEFFSTVLDVLAINLGNPIIHVSTSTGPRLTLMLYVLYSTVVTTAYKTSLASILATAQGSATVVDLQGIIEGNFKIGGSRYNLNVFIDQDSTSELATKLIARYEVIHNHSELMRRLKSESDFACLSRRAAFLYQKLMAADAKESTNFDVFSTCVLTYPSVIVFPEGSYLRDPIDKIIWQVLEAGLSEYWRSTSYVNEKLLKHRIAVRLSEESNRQKFGKIFVLYIGCLFVCISVFLIEVLASKLKPKKTQRTVRRRL